MQKIIPHIPKRFGQKVRIILRGDGGFCRDAIMSWCESQSELYYCLGMPTNVRLRKIIASKLGKLRHDIAHDRLELPTRRFTQFNYTTLKSWTCKRRVIAKLEVLSKGEKSICSPLVIDAG